MKSISRIKFNPNTKEIEVEGSEQFVKTYFKKLQTMLSDSEVAEKEPGRGKTAKKSARAAARGKKPAKQSNKTSRVLALIEKSPQGIATADLEKKTGMTGRQIWAIVYRTEKKGKVKKVKRGVYAAV
jgi:predicted Rossmann fold nucleotide-binding protein DprA/Smf involved in DNA uptake